MLHTYFNSFYITGKKEAVGQLFQSLEALKSKDKVFRALTGAPATAAGDAMKEYYGVHKDVSKSALEYNLHSATEIYANMETDAGIPEGFFLKLSATYHVSVDVEYESPTDNAAGKIVFENGEEKIRKEYSFMEGKYHLDTAKDKSVFWEELQVRTEDVYCNNYETAAEIIKEELPFLDKKEQQRFIKLYANIS